MITHLSSRADGARKKLKDLNEQVGEHVYAVAQSYASIFIFQCLLYVYNCLQLDNHLDSNLSVRRTSC